MRRVLIILAVLVGVGLSTIPAAWLLAASKHEFKETKSTLGNFQYQSGHLRAATLRINDVAYTFMSDKDLRRHGLLELITSDVRSVELRCTGVYIVSRLKGGQFDKLECQVRRTRATGRSPPGAFVI